MPQIWMTYDELAALMNCDREQARAAAAAIPLDRRKSHDGQTRAKLTPSLADAFLDAMVHQRLSDEIATCTTNLQAIHERMSARPRGTALVRMAASG